VLDTFVAIMSGLIIFPACFTYNIDVDAGPNLIFVTLPRVFMNMPLGSLWGSLFFLFMTFAAMSTIFAVFQNIMSCVQEITGGNSMAKRTDLKKILIIGSGPIVIGQAAEFDYAGTQACLALKEEGYEVVLCNSNPATIMTDTSIADKVYMEPLTLEYIAKILRYERPDAILPGIGGQTGLNLAMQLEKKGVLKECDVELLGTSSASIERAEDRELFKEMCQQIGEPVIPSEITYSIEEAKAAAERIGYPVVLRPAFTLGGTGGGFAYS
jgi:hypothetical protein